MMNKIEWVEDEDIEMIEQIEWIPSCSHPPPQEDELGQWIKTGQVLSLYLWG